MTDTADRVKAIVREQFGVEADKVTESASFFDDLGADSLDTVELVIILEGEFDIEIPYEEFDRLNTVGEAIAVVQRLTSAAA